MVSKSHPEYLNGDLISCTKGKVVVKDKNGDRFQVDVTDPRYLNGELVGINMGIKRPDRYKEISIYNVLGKLVVATNGDFKKKCLTLKLPFIALKNLYLKGGMPIYLNPRSNLKN